MNRLLTILLTTCLAASLALAALATAPASAAPGPDPVSAGGWSWIVEPYFMAPNMRGTSGVKGFTSDVDENTGDILGALDFGAMLYLEMKSEKTAVSIDNLYMNLGGSGTTALGTIEADLRQTGVSVTGYRRFAPALEGTLGVTFNHLKEGLKGSGPLGLDVSGHQTWVDPYVGIRLSTPHPRRWRLTFTGAVGGFGVGSDFAWQAYPEIGYRCSPGFELSGGYRAIDMKYENGTGNERFLYDITTYGPQLGAKIHF